MVSFQQDLKPRRIKNFRREYSQFLLSFQGLWTKNSKEIIKALELFAFFKFGNSNGENQTPPQQTTNEENFLKMFLQSLKVKGNGTQHLAIYISVQEEIYAESSH